jgi:hypothetical protein
MAADRMAADRMVADGLGVNPIRVLSKRCVEPYDCG